MSTRAWSRSVSTTGTSSRRSEQQAELAGHEAGADDAHLGDVAGQRLGWAPRPDAWPAAAPGRRRTGRCAAPRPSRGRPGLRPRPAGAGRPTGGILGQGQQVQGPVRRRRARRAAARRAWPRAKLEDRVPHLAPVDLRPRHRDVAPHDRRPPTPASAPGSRPARAGHPRCPSRGPGPARSILFCMQRVLHDDLSALMMPIRFGSSCVPPQAGHQPERDLGQGDGGRRRWTASGTGSAARARTRRP